MDVTDLSGLDPAAARTYVLGYLTTLRVTRNRRRELEAAKRTWEGRIERAEAVAEPKLHWPRRPPNWRGCRASSTGSWPRNGSW